MLRSTGRSRQGRKTNSGAIQNCSKSKQGAPPLAGQDGWRRFAHSHSRVCRERIFQHSLLQLAVGTGEAKSDSFLVSFLGRNNKLVMYGKTLISGCSTLSFWPMAQVLGGLQLPSPIADRRENTCLAFPW